MANEEFAELEAKNLANAEEERQIAEAAEAEKRAEEKEPNPYEEELNRVRESEAKAKRDAAHKELELQKSQREKKELKDKLEELQAKPNPSNEEKSELQKLTELVTDLSKKLDSRSIDDVVERVTSDVKERELIKHHYEHSIKLTGILEEDIATARFLANRNIMLAMAKEEGMQDKANEVLARLSGTSPAGMRDLDAVAADPSMERVLDKISPKAKDEFRKILKEKVSFV